MGASAGLKIGRTAGAVDSLGTIASNRAATPGLRRRLPPVTLKHGTTFYLKDQVAGRPAHQPSEGIDASRPSLADSSFNQKLYPSFRVSLKLDVVSPHAYLFTVRL